VRFLTIFLEKRHALCTPFSLPLSSCAGKRHSGKGSFLSKLIQQVWQFLLIGWTKLLCPLHWVVCLQNLHILSLGRSVQHLPFSQRSVALCSQCR